jgi:hypothetical protein
VLDEILIRLLRSPGGTGVAQLRLALSRVHKVAKALAWMRDHIAEPMHIAALAKKEIQPLFRQLADQGHRQIT